MEWYIAKTYGHASRASDALRRAGVRSFAPLELRTVVRRGKRYEVRRPLFPGYIFVHIDLTTWQRCDGVSYLLGRDSPIPVMDGYVSALIQSGTIDRRRGVPFRKHQRVQAVVDELRGWMARVDSIDEARGRVLCVGSNGLKAWLSSDDVEAID